jgi:hypothetical protein
MKDLKRSYLRGFSVASEGNYVWFVDLLPYIPQIAKFSRDIKVMPYIPKLVKNHTGETSSKKIIK